MERSRNTSAQPRCGSEEILGAALYLPAWQQCSSLRQPLCHHSGLDLHLQILDKGSSNSRERTAADAAPTSRKHPAKGTARRKGQRYLQQRSPSPILPSLKEHRLIQAHPHGLWTSFFLQECPPALTQPRAFLDLSQGSAFGEMLSREEPTWARRDKLVH